MSRSILGIQETESWLKNFNIGTMMYIKPMTYEDFVFSADFLFEMTQKHI